MGKVVPKKIVTDGSNRVEKTRTFGVQLCLKN